MSQIAQRPDLPASVRDVLGDLFLRICIPVLKQRVIEQCLSDAERREVLTGVNPRKMAYVVPGRHILNIIAKHRGWSFKRTLIEVALASDLLGVGKYQFLRREIGELIEFETTGIRTAPKCTMPKWDHEAGELTLGNKVLRRVRINNKPSRVQRLFAAFEQSNWKSFISNPFAQLSQTDLHHLLYEINRLSKGVQFHARGGGKEIGWSLETRV
jgi:hypothetical protein